MSRRHPRGKPDGRTSAERGYGSAHRKARQAFAQVVASGGATCSRCGGPILPGSHWDLDHTDDRSGYLGPAHRSCNRGHAGRSKRPAPSRNESPITPGDPRPLVRGALWQRTPESPVYVIGRHSRQWTEDHPPVDGAMYSNGNETETA